MKVLALETSSATGSIALLTDERLALRHIGVSREQTAKVLPLIDELLAEAGIRPAGLDAIAFGRGPGSFTGLRVAAAVAQGLAFASAVPLLPVSSLAATAQRAWREHGWRRTLVVTDARMGEVYCGRFEVRDGLAAPLDEEKLLRPAEVRPLAGQAWLAAGSGFAAHGTALAEVTAAAAGVEAELEPAAEDLLPLALEILRHGGAVDVAAALPVYLRGADAWRRS